MKFLMVLGFLLSMLLAGCKGQTSAGSGRASASPAAPSATPTLGPQMFANPVIDQDFPDPDIVRVGDTYYAYATNFGSVNVQMAASQDLVEWEMLKDALPVLPPWVRPGLTWAPEVAMVGENAFVMYFTARDKASNKQCIGIATSDSPRGPFRGQERPFICQADQGGSIDASSFLDGDTRYVLWKNDGNCCGKDTWIYIQRVSPDGLTLQGEPARLIKQTLLWEGNLVEAPTLWKHDGRYYLLYSANSYSGGDYAVGYASADSILGPYSKAEQPLLATDYEHGAAFGPGGQDIVHAPDGTTWLAYHSWDPTLSYRRMQIDRLVWSAGKPVVKGPTRQPQQRP